MHDCEDGHCIPLINIGFIVSLIAGTYSLSSAFASAGAERLPLALALLGLTWLATFWRAKQQIGGAVLLIFVCSAAYGLWIELPPSRLILGALGGLLAWDLEEFRLRLKHALPTEDVRAMGSRHMVRLGIVALAGLSLAAFVWLFDLKLTAGIVLILAVVGGIGLLALAVWLSRRGN